MKEIVKNAKQPVKSRIIPPDILEKYKAKVEELKESIEQVLKEEMEERLMEKAEKQLNQMEKKLSANQTGVSTAREWFQTKKQRQLEKGIINFNTHSYYSM